MSPTLLLLIVVGLLCAPVAAIGARAWSTSRQIVLPTFVALLAAVVGAFGLFALSFQGYVEDYGNEPANTLDLAIPFLGESVLLYLVGWRVASKRRSQGFAWLAVAGGVLCAVLLARSP